MGWREDLSILHGIYTGNEGGGWRENVIDMAISRGYSPSGWRNAIGFLAKDHGVAAADWRGELQGISMALGQTERVSWRKSVAFIREYYEENPPSSLPFKRVFDSIKRAVKDSNQFYLVVRR